MDGVEFLANKLVETSEEQGCFYRRQREGRLNGYFAQHLYAKQQVIYRLAGQNLITEIHCEIQIASDMATSMWNAAHAIYEHARIGEEDRP